MECGDKFQFVKIEKFCDMQRKDVFHKNIKQQR